MYDVRVFHHTTQQSVCKYFGFDQGTITMKYFPIELIVIPEITLTCPNVTNNLTLCDK